ncbi:MAG TPA: PhnD/SsuA/transferrin family substrate-binding protein [Chloroflexota bacterium]|nr:PhnD/SsuA/transferrin family substrate-binding protein [Chloroflexota bacterium]
MKLTLACWDYDRTRPLIDGRVRPEGIDLDVQVHRPHVTFSRMLERQEFDVSEMSLSSYVSLVARGDCAFVAIPVALSKIFRHSCIYVRTGAGIDRPEDLKGKRVGSIRYGSTGTVFMRGMLQDEYSVRPDELEWFLGRLNTATDPINMDPPSLPAGIRATALKADQTLEGMLEAGELDALLSLYIPTSFEAGAPWIARLFPNFKQVEQESYRRTRIFPIMHTVVIRRDVYDRDPWIAPALYKAFCAARDLAVNGLYDTDALRLALPWLIDHVEEARRVFGDDFWAYGLEPNRPTFAAVGRYLFEQGLAPRIVSPDELFLPGCETPLSC